MTDDPIIPPPEGSRLSVVAPNIIDLAGIRVQWGLPATKRQDRCDHNGLLYSEEERRVWCGKCNRTVENFEAFMVFVRHFREIESAARVKMRKAEEAMRSSVRRRATKELDRLWAGEGRAVSCPHCKNGLLPEDFANGVGWSAREYELARRKRKP